MGVRLASFVRRKPAAKSAPPTFDESLPLERASLVASISGSEYHAEMSIFEIFTGAHTQKGLSTLPGCPRSHCLGSYSPWQCTGLPAGPSLTLCDSRFVFCHLYASQCVTNLLLISPFSPFPFSL